MLYVVGLLLLYLISVIFMRVCGADTLMFCFHFFCYYRYSFGVQSVLRC